jgi:hypothetical protein
MTRYKTADTSTLKGLKYGEWLKSHGWTIIKTGLYLIWFEKKQ